MKASTNYAIVALVFLTVANVTVWWLAHNDVWPWQYTWYVYWAESVVIGTLALFMYAKHLLVFFMLLILTSYMVGLQNLMLLGDMKIPMTFWGFYSLFWLIYFEVRRSYLGHSIRMMHPLYQLAYYFVFMFFAILLACAATAYIYYGQIFVPNLQASLLEQFFAMAVGIPTLTITVLKIVDMIGEQHVFYFLLGTYHRPAEKRHIVMFIDMVGSSAAAEKLPPLKSMDMIAQFIFDASYSCRVHGGDIVNYTGDGVMVLWPFFQGDKVIKAYDTLMARLENRRAAYEGSFGMIPDFRMGVHAGSVVISQIGEEKLFLGVYGDVVNTASRIEQMNKEMGTRILISKAVKQYVGLALQKRIKPIGMTEVRGREESVEVFAVS
jgi:adenylate cyclase